MFSSSSNYTFNASALGLGGVLNKQGRRIVIPSLASVALAPTGGEGSALVENYHANGISFSRAESRVSGYETSPGRFGTYCDIYLTNVSIFDKLKIALLHATVQSERDLQDDDSQFELNATYRGVSYEGQEVVPKLDINVCSRSNYFSLGEAIAQTLDGLETPEGEVNEADMVREAVSRRDPIRSSLVQDLEGPAVETEGVGIARGRRPNHLIVPGFGNLHFGELLVKPGRRRVNLLRIEFDEEGMVSFSGGSGSGGSMTIGSGDGNGAPIWPNG